jgi:ribosomal protein S18 acetylase RimI-like enzyme
MLAAAGPIPVSMPRVKAEPNLRPLRADEYDAWRRAVTDGYAAEIETLGDTPHDAARTKAEADMARVLPEGLATTGHSICVLELGGERVGQLWLAERTLDDRQVMFVYDVEVDEAQRGRGLGRAAMLLAESEAGAKGIGRMELNVFGGNSVARELYRSLGYLERAVSMGKDLGDPPASR